MYMLLLNIFIYLNPLRYPMRIKTLFSTVFFLCFLSGLGYMGYLFFEDREGPSISLEPNTGAISPTATLTLKLSDPSKVRSVEVLLHQGTQSTSVFSKHFDPYQVEQSVAFTINTPLAEGEYELELKAMDASLASFGLGNSSSEILPVRLDAKAPRVNISSLPPNVRRGGSAAISYSVNEEVRFSGVQLGEHFFPGHKQANNTYVAYMAFPHTMKVEEFKPVLKTQDLAGNQVELPLRVHAIDKKFKEDTIKITDAFLDRVSAKLVELAPNAATPLERFLLINSDIRFANTQFLYGLGKQTASKQLWQGSFIPLPRAASRAGYGEYRTYEYEGKVIDNQWHLGHDLASVKQAKIPVANTGKVIFVGDLGIYGNIVVVDHGLGLMSLYSHLTNIMVNKDQELKKGDIVGTTGVTGMAFGDHVHFGMLVHGIEVNPLEWLDTQWIKNNISDRLHGK